MKLSVLLCDLAYNGLVQHINIDLETYLWYYDLIVNMFTSAFILQDNSHVAQSSFKVFHPI